MPCDTIRGRGAARGASSRVQTFPRKAPRRDRMDNLSIDALAQRLAQLERDNRRWQCAAGVATLGMALSLALGGLLGSRAVGAGPPPFKLDLPTPVTRGLEYKVTDAMFLNQL